MEDASHPPGISISRASTASIASSTRSKPPSLQEKTPPQRVDTKNTDSSPWYRKNGDTPRHRRSHSPDVEWHIKWTKNCFPNGRVLIIDYISNDASSVTSPSGKRHIVVAAQEFQDLTSLEKFYTDPRRAYSAALRVIHVQNATWATHSLLNKFNIDHPSEVVGMQGFSKWARYEKPRQRNGKPFPNGRAFREQTDPWRNISRTAFGLDYLKTHPTAPPNRRKQSRIFGEMPVDAKMMHLDVHDDSRSPHGYDVSVQRLSVYVQRTLGAPGQVSPDVEIKNPYTKHMANGDGTSKKDGDKVDLELLDNTNTVIVFETSASMLLEDCLVQPRNDFEKRWRRLSFYLKKEEALNDARLAAQCTNIILSDVFHGLAIVWESFLNAAQDHVNMLEDKIYENSADESRAPELWTNQAAWLKVDKVMWIHQDLVKQMQSQMKALAEVEPGDEDEVPIPPPDWLSSTPAEYEKLGHSVQEDLVQPTANLSDLMYKSVGIRDSRQSLQLGLSMWRLSWITFIFLPLTFVVSFFGMNVSLFNNPYPNIGWCIVCNGAGKHHTNEGYTFDQLEDEYPLLWSSKGAIDEIEPTGLANRLKWQVLKRWFAPDHTINKKLYSSLAPGGEDTELGAWARVKRYFLLRWLPQILAERRLGDPVAMAEVGSSRASLHTLHTEPAAFNELMQMSTPLAMASAEPTAIAQISTYGLRPLSLTERRTSSGTPKQSIEERPSSRGSSGIMIEERNFSDSESEAGEGANDHLPDGSPHAAY